MKGSDFLWTVPASLPILSLFCLQLVQQWPQAQKSALKDTEEEHDAGGISLDEARARLQEEDRFDKEEYRKKIKAKHRVSCPRESMPSATQRAHSPKEPLDIPYGFL